MKLALLLGLFLASACATVWVVTNDNSFGAGSIEEAFENLEDGDSITFDSFISTISSNIVFRREKAFVLDGENRVDFTGSLNINGGAPTLKRTKFTDNDVWISAATIINLENNLFVGSAEVKIQDSGDITVQENDFGADTRITITRSHNIALYDNTIRTKIELVHVYDLVDIGSESKPNTLSAPSWSNSPILMITPHFDEVKSPSIRIIGNTFGEDGGAPTASAISHVGKATELIISKNTIYESGNEASIKVIGWNGIAKCEIRNNSITSVTTALFISFIEVLTIFEDNTIVGPQGASNSYLLYSNAAPVQFLRNTIEWEYHDKLFVIPVVNLNNPEVQYVYRGDEIEFSSKELEQAGLLVEFYCVRDTTSTSIGQKETSQEPWTFKVSLEDNPCCQRFSYSISKIGPGGSSITSTFSNAVPDYNTFDLVEYVPASGKTGFALKTVGKVSIRADRVASVSFDLEISVTAIHVHFGEKLNEIPQVAGQLAPEKFSQSPSGYAGPGGYYFDANFSDSERIGSIYIEAEESVGETTILHQLWVKGASFAMAARGSPVCDDSKGLYFIN